MLVSVSISLNEQPRVDLLMHHVMLHGKLDLGHLNMDNLPLTIHVC